jgi:hypothetical protein
MLAIRTKELSKPGDAVHASSAIVGQDCCMATSLVAECSLGLQAEEEPLLSNAHLAW